MKFVPILFVFVVGALVGGLVSPALTGSSDPPPGTAADGGRVAASPVPATAEEPEVDQGTPVPASAASGAEEESLLARAIAAVEPVDVGARDGEITVAVQVVGGGPLAGVEFTASPHRRPDREEAKTVEEKVRRTIRDLRYEETLEVTATSDAEGRARLSSIGEGSYRVHGKVPGYRLEGLGNSGRAEAGDHIDFRATPVATIHLAVRAADGGFVRRAEVSIERGNHTNRRPWTADEPEIEVDPGPFRLVVRHEDGGVGRTDELVAEVGTGPLEVTVTLEARGRVEAEVVFPPGERMQSATVYLLPVSMKSDPTPEDLRGAPQQSTSHGGRPVTFEDLDPGEYWIGAARGWGHEGHEPSIVFIEVGTGTLEVEVPIPGSDLSQGIIVRAFGPGGHPVPDVRLRLSVKTETQGTRGGGGVETSLADGSVLLEPDESMRSMLSLPGAIASLTAVSSTYGSESIEVAAFDGTAYEIRFREPARASVYVPGYLGSDYLGRIRVQLDAAGDEQSNVWFGGPGGGQGKPDAEGKVEVGPISPGEYTLRLIYFDDRDNRWRSNDIARQPVSVVPGENTFSIPLPPLYTVEVHFPDGAATGNVQLNPVVESSGPNYGSNSPIVDGIARVEGLAAGEYTLRAWGTGISSSSGMTIQVPTGGPIVFDPPPVNAIRVTVSDPDGAMATAGFRDGDIIRRINGQPFEGEEQLAMLGILLQGANEVTVTVGRDGGEVDLVVNPKDMMSGSPGGRFQPTSE